MEEVIRREKAETWETVAQIENKADNHEIKIQEDGKKILGLGRAQKSTRFDQVSERRGKLGYLDETQRLDGVGGTARGILGDVVTRNRGLQECCRGQDGHFATKHVSLSQWCKQGITTGLPYR